MAPSQPKSGLFVGINKGHVVTKCELSPCPSYRKGELMPPSSFAELQSGSGEPYSLNQVLCIHTPAGGGAAATALAAEEKKEEAKEESDDDMGFSLFD